jgi:hypothetical protein
MQNPEPLPPILDPEADPAEAVAGGRLIHQCGALKPSGVQCGLRMVAWVEGLGWRCRHHRAKPQQATPVLPDAPSGPPASPEPRPKPPVSKIETWHDMAKLLGWAALELANDTTLSQARASGIAALGREWRQARVEIVKWETVQVAIEWHNALMAVWERAQELEPAAFARIGEDRKFQRLTKAFDAAENLFAPLHAEVAARADLTYQEQEKTP